MKTQIFFCVSTLAVLISSANSQFPGYGQQYDLQGYGTDCGVGIDPLLALRLKNYRKLNKLNLGCEHAAGKAAAIKSKCSKMFAQQLMKNKLALQELNSPFNGFSADQLYNQGQIYNAQPSAISAAQLQAASPQCLQGAATLPNYQAAALQNLQGAALPNFQSAAFQNLPGATLQGLQGLAVPNLQSSALSNFQGSALTALQGLQGAALQNYQSCSLPNAQKPPVQIQNIQIPFEQIQRMSSEPIEYGTPINHRVFNISPNQNFDGNFQGFGPQSGFQQQPLQGSPCMGGSPYEEFTPIGSPESQYQGGQFQNGPVPFPSSGDYTEGYPEGAQQSYN